MYIDPVLREKWKVQQKPAKEANYKIDNLAKNAHLNVLELVKRSNLNLKYSKLKGGYIKKIESLTNRSS
ncbi:MAG: hypothetical protein ACUZ8H_02640 [Candidatus Anammoxibacter sp.]